MRREGGGYREDVLNAAALAGFGGDRIVSERIDVLHQHVAAEQANVTTGGRRSDANPVVVLDHLEVCVVLKVISALHQLANANTTEQVVPRDISHDMRHLAPSVRSEEIVVECIQ